MEPGSAHLLQQAPGHWLTYRVCLDLQGTIPATTPSEDNNYPEYSAKPMIDELRGFTALELIAAILILGVLSAIALPRFIDLTDEALDGSVQGVAGSLSSGSAINYGAFAVNSAEVGVQRLNTANVCTQTALGPLLSSGSESGNGNGNSN